MNKHTFFLSVLVAAASWALTTQAADSKPGYTDTPKLPGGKWRVHDSERPQPRVVTPGTFSSQNQPGKPPSDAIVLFDGTDLSKWRDGSGKAPGWKVENGAMIVPPKGTPGGGDIWTKEEFGDCQLHIEFATPNPPKGESQGRGNSGVFFMGGRYELQVLDSYNNPTYADGSAASLYGQYPPLVNASRPPGEWQTYDIVFLAPRFKDGKVEKPAIITVFHNGVLVQHHTAYHGPSSHRNTIPYEPHPEKGPLKLQDHNDPVRFRNIWIRPLKMEDRP